jgi:cob(I)alamin adenosyltransferase
MAFKIYTKTGDGGETGLFGGKRIPKDDLRIEAYGTIDELNALVGGLADRLPGDDDRAFLREIQADLFVIGSHLAKDPDKNLPLPDLPLPRIEAMEAAMDHLDESLPPLKNFILPGGHPIVSYAHLARCVCRRAERRVVSLSRDADVDPDIVRYLNRLSDYLFVLARSLSSQLGVEEIKWMGE